MKAINRGSTTNQTSFLLQSEALFKKLVSLFPPDVYYPDKETKKKALDADKTYASELKQFINQRMKANKKNPILESPNLALKSKKSNMTNGDVKYPSEAIATIVVDEDEANKPNEIVKQHEAAVTDPDLKNKLKEKLGSLKDSRTSKKPYIEELKAKRNKRKKMDDKAVDENDKNLSKREKVMKEMEDEIEKKKAKKEEKKQHKNEESKNKKRQRSESMGTNDDIENAKDNNNKKFVTKPNVKSAVEAKMSFANLNSSLLESTKPEPDKPIGSKKDTQNLKKRLKVAKQHEDHVKKLKSSDNIESNAKGLTKEFEVMEKKIKGEVGRLNNPHYIKKEIKKIEKQKEKSKNKWQQRERDEKKQLSDRIDKRQKNIDTRNKSKVERKMRLKGIISETKSPKDVKAKGNADKPEKRKRMWVKMKQTEYTKEQQQEVTPKKS